MSKILAFLGSPRKNGYTTQLINQVLEGAESAGAEVVVYSLNDNKIKGCQGCFYCRSHEGCATIDNLSPMYEDIRTASGIVAGFPIYFGDVSGQAKLWLNRLYPMLDVQFAPRYPGKKVVSVYAQANPDDTLFTNAIDTTNQFFQLCGWELIDCLHIYGNTAPSYTIPPQIMKRAFDAGKKLL